MKDINEFESTKSDDLIDYRFAELKKYLLYLEQRWADGERNATQLGRELKEKGYRGKVSTVGHYLVRWREICPDRMETAAMVKAKLRRFAVPSPKKTYWLIFKPRLTDEKWSNRYIAQILKESAILPVFFISGSKLSETLSRSALFQRLPESLAGCGRFQSPGVRHSDKFLFA